MAIDSLTFATPQAYSAVDFSPLANLGQALQQKQQQQQLANLGDIYGAAPPASASAPAPASAPSSGGGNYANAISGIESGGKYDLLGPITKSGDRAYGKYQVMGANIPEWTREVLGKAMTPEEFRSNPAAQDAVFNSKFGSYVAKYGPRDAAKAWFAGERGMHNPDASDILGTTVESYANKFIRGLGQ